MDCQRIILNYSVPPSMEDIEVMAATIVESLPEEIARHCEDLVVVVEDIADDLTLADVDLDDPYELLALFKSGKEIAPGIQRKVANEEDVLMLYRRAILDMWCEMQDDLISVLRSIVIEELGRSFELSEDDLNEMMERHY